MINYFANRFLVFPQRVVGLKACDPPAQPPEPAVGP
jgi:hypothetical protein